MAVPALACSDGQWRRSKGSFVRSHDDATIQWLWVNPALVAAVYRLVGMAVRDAPDRTLRSLRWLRHTPFQAVAGFSDGWALFLWCGIWEDRTRLDRRLGRCVDEIDHKWHGAVGRRHPGRIVFVVPHRWQAEPGRFREGAE